MSRLKPVTPNGWIMLCAPPASIRSTVAAADHLRGFADRLAAGGAGGQAVRIRALSIEHPCQIAGRHVRFLFQFGGRIERFQPDLDELVNVQAILIQPAGDHLGKGEEILISFAAAQIDAEARGVEVALEDARTHRWLVERRRRQIACAVRGTARVPGPRRSP